MNIRRADETRTLAPAAPAPVSPAAAESAVVTIQLNSTDLHITASGDDPAATPSQGVISDSRSIYAIRRVVDHGGMGTVYEACDQRLNRAVALKTMRHGDDPVQVQRFVEEAQVTSQLEHPNIVPVHELGVDADGRLYFTMKLVRGKTLAAHIAEWQHQPLNPARLFTALTIIIKVCDALAFAHAKGVVHRDIKPANIMIGEYGEVLVMDWGIARVRSQHGITPTAAEPPPAGHGAPGVGSASEASPTATPLAGDERGGATSATAVPRAAVEPSWSDATANTQDGEVIGTPGYMAPEQAAGDRHAIGPACDIYSVGAIIYEVLTGSRPIAGSSATEVIQRTVIGAVVAPRERCPEHDIPDELDALAMKALALDPAQRYPSIGALAGDLQAYLAGRSVSARPDSVAQALRKLIHRNRTVAVTIACSSLVVVLVLVASFIHVVGQRDIARQALVERDLAQDALSLADRQRLQALSDESERTRRRLHAFTPYVTASDLLARGGFTPQALALLRQAVAIDGDFLEAHFALGEALRASGDPHAAANEFLTANVLNLRLTGKPHLPSLLDAAFALDDAGYFPESLALFTRIEANGAQDPLVLVARCFRYGYADACGQALESAQQAVASEPRLWETHFALGYALVQAMSQGLLPPSRRLDAIDQLARAMRMAPNRAEPCTWMAIALMGGDISERAQAVALFDHAIALEPGNANRYLNRVTLRVRLNDLAGARQDLAMAEKLGAPSEPLVKARYEIAEVSGQLREADADLAQLAHLFDSPYVIGTWLRRCIITGQADALRGDIATFRQRYPHTAWCAMVDAALAEQHTATGQALSDIDEALGYAPYLMDALISKLRLLQEAGRFDESLRLARSMLDLWPMHYIAGIRAVRALRWLHQPEQARQLFETIAAAHPEYAADIARMRDQTGWLTIAPSVSH